MLSTVYRLGVSVRGDCAPFEVSRKKLLWGVVLVQLIENGTRISVRNGPGGGGGGGRLAQEDKIKEFCLDLGGHEEIPLFLAVKLSFGVHSKKWY